MRVLWLTNSDDLLGPEAERPSALVAARVADVLAVPVEITPRVIWPSPELPDIIDSWIRRYAPDLVMLHVNGYWYLYRSVPERLVRRFGLPGRLAGRATARAGRSSRLSHTAAFHAGRRIALRVLGGETHFTAAETSDLAARCIRQIVRHEGPGLVVRVGDGAQFLAGAPGDDVERVHRAVSSVCRDVHATCVDGDLARPGLPPDDYWRRGDRVHMSIEGRHWYAARDAEALVAEFRRRLAPESR